MRNYVTELFNNHAIKANYSLQQNFNDDCGVLYFV
jgi:hypothetical protein